ncbi:S1 family peptidase [Peijinzhouia sedimentorum]
MFSEAIEQVSNFTRAIHTISRNYQSQQITPGAGTLFFVNELGYAVTCKHVAELLIQANNINNHYEGFKKERELIPKDGKFKKQLRALEIKYGYDPKKTAQMKINFVGCIDKMSGFTWHLHPEYDLAIVIFNGFQQLGYDQFAVFPKDTESIKPGNFLCRLGYPFPEFSNFQYNDSSDDIEWTQTGNPQSPRFPLEGMVTRFLVDRQGNKNGIELSTPGLRGQSGGPLFDREGLVYGMQSQTKHLHLGFDIENKSILSNGQLKKVSDYSFIHLGECVHAETIKDFLRKHQVKFYEK